MKNMFDSTINLLHFSNYHAEQILNKCWKNIHKYFLDIIKFFFIERHFKEGHFIEHFMRGGRPATTVSRPSHILLIFSSEPPRNPRPSIIIYFKVSNFEDKTIFFNLATLGHKIWICNDYIFLESSNPWEWCQTWFS